MSKMGAYVLDLMEQGVYPCEPSFYEGPFDPVVGNEIVCAICEGSHGYNAQCQRNG